MSNDRKVDSMSNNKWMEEFYNRFSNSEWYNTANNSNHGIKGLKNFIKQLLAEQRKVYKEKIAMLEAKCEVLENDLDNAYEQQYLGGE